MSAESFQAPSLEHLAEVLPAYDFEAFIAQGGMGAVYKARQRSLDRDVAIKILPRELGADPEFRQSFETEAKAMARLNHPNLIGVYDFGDVEGMPYIVMEYVNGKSLFHSAYNTAIDPVQAVTIVKGICDGLAHAHENGVIHRDIKPANILLTPKAEPKIGDFGLARPAGEDSSGIIMGTPGYAAPEITRHPDHADRRSDLFALGVVLYELLIGRCPPYDHQPPPSTVVGCDPALDRICEKAAHPVADLRYASAEAMSAALDEWLRKPAAGHVPLPPPTSARRMRRVAGAGSGSYETAESGSGGMVKGLLMTAAAVAIVAVGWGKYRDMQAAKAAAVQAATGGNRSTVTVEKTPAGKAGTDNPGNSALVPVKPEPARTTESPLKSLARLKSALAAGKRDEMPAGSISMAGTDILIVPTPMTRYDAVAFAEDHGGHLFVVSSERDLDQLSALVPAGEEGADQGLWLGVGRVGKDVWRSVDGSEWPVSSKPAGTGMFAVLDGNGGVKVREALDRYPFVIQWQKDGSNPATLRAALRRTGESIAAGKAVFPPGTFAFGGSYVFIAVHRSTATEAEELALGAGGHLVSLDTAEKDAWLADKLSGFSGDRGFWIGATREEETWKWSSGAKWDFTRWEDENQAAAAGTCINIAPGEGWRNAYRDDPASGFIVEWSASAGADAGSGDMASAAGDAPLSLPPAIMELELKAKDLLVAAARKRDIALEKNVKDFHWKLDTWLGDLSKNEQANWVNHVSLLKARAKDGRVPRKVTGIRMSERMAGAVEFCAQKQESIDAAFQQEMRKIRDAYLTRVSDAMASASEVEKKALDQRTELSADLDAWAQALGSVVVAKQAPAASFSILSANYGARGKDADVTARVKKLMLEEQRIFWVNPRDLGTDPNPGWNKTLTVKFEANGVKGKKSWGENSKVDPVELMKEASAVGDTAPPSAGGGSNPFGTPTMPVLKVDPLVGDWKWNTGNTYIFKEDGTVTVNGDTKNKGTWVLKSESATQRAYEVSWPLLEVTDRFAMKGDLDMIQGSNSNGDKILAKRKR